MNTLNAESSIPVASGGPEAHHKRKGLVIIGMTSQVSDVQIASRSIRRWALLHGAIAFAFNAAVLALSINVISGLF